jgi:hypothetical protein
MHFEMSSMLVLVQPEQRNVQKAEGIAGNRCLKLADIEHIFFVVAF